MSTNRTGSCDREPLAKTAQVAEYLATTVNQLTRLRYEGKGPRPSYCGRSVRYRWCDVDDWVREQTARAGGDAG
ncbi:helix-turn-helix transcriptional regulator [Mycobacterium vicinigordonae]|uniref:DNA-binding protein n=1 Tax=Mycobacterium vicinigordonae TaxID=1719132 RepID=A0A7D6E888_9MYCO|nr:DNA-binding protein [Mycobacterium vicinigordonae]QLL08983.1 DNA-binding protein [Mycobacterium vicinigordonae]